MIFDDDVTYRPRCMQRVPCIGRAGDPYSAAAAEVAAEPARTMSRTAGAAVSVAAKARSSCALHLGDVKTRARSASPVDTSV
jgi:hypothetical protein